MSVVTSLTLRLAAADARSSLMTRGMALLQSVDPPRYHPPRTTPDRSQFGVEATGAVRLRSAHRLARVAVDGVRIELALRVQPGAERLLSKDHFDVPSIARWVLNLLRRLELRRDDRRVDRASEQLPFALDEVAKSSTAPSIDWPIRFTTPARDSTSSAWRSWMNGTACEPASEMISCIFFARSTFSSCDRSRRRSIRASARWWRHGDVVGKLLDQLLAHANFFDEEALAFE
jgi:hypothetical protein